MPRMHSGSTDGYIERYGYQVHLCLDITVAIKAPAPWASLAFRDQVHLCLDITVAIKAPTPWALLAFRDENHSAPAAVAKKRRR